MAQSSGVGSLVKWGLIAAVGYYVYETYFAATAAPAGAQVFPTLKPGPVVAPPAATPPATPPASSRTLDSIYQALVTASAGTSQSGVDGWGYYLNEVLNSNGMGAAPDPIAIFKAANPGFDRGTAADNFTLAQYWAVMGPALKTQFGLSGIGHFAGLGALYGRRAAR